MLQNKYSIKHILNSNMKDHISPEKKIKHLSDQLQGLQKIGETGIHRGMGKIGKSNFGAIYAILDVHGECKK